MKEKIKLITTDSYFNVFEILKKELAGKTEGLSGKNLIFCDEKISLMAERHLCSINGGSFNTQVYSFGNYLRVKKGNLTALSKEGSAMAIRKILGDVNLKKFSSSKTDLAPTLYELIMQLKSASVSPEEIKSAISDTDGVLSFKLEDIFAVYSAYEDFLLKNGFEDQSSSLSYLPKVLSSDDSIKDANVFLLGFTGWTRQARDVIETLIKRAKSVTAIVAEGENEFLFVNETAESFLNICKKLSVPVNEERKSCSQNGRNEKKEEIQLDHLAFDPDPAFRRCDHGLPDSQ
jgi:ATP-dependent helicase/nuclease subunit B